jgi:hypothetical protein
MDIIQMFFYKVLSVLFFTFTPIISFHISNNNYKNYKNNYKNTLNMGCDYYIEKNLYIYYKDNTINYINLKKDKGYFYEIHYDMGFDLSLYKSSEEAKRILKEYHLKPAEMPLLIYSDDKFTNVDLSKKYKSTVDYEIRIHDYKTWDDIKSIVLMEERYERD